MHDCMPLLNFRSLVFEISKLKFTAHNNYLFVGLLKWANKHISKAGGVVGAIPESMGHHIL